MSIQMYECSVTYNNNRTYALGWQLVHQASIHDYIDSVI